MTRSDLGSTVRRLFADPGYAGAFVLTLGLVGCHEEGGGHAPSVLGIAQKATAPNPNAGLSSEPYLASAPRVEVTGFPDRPRFFVLARTAALEKYPCSTCHTVPLERMRGPAGSPRRASRPPT